MNDLISRSALLKQVSKVKEEYLHPYIVGSILQAPPVDAVPVVRCCECKRRYDADECPMCFLVDGEYHEYTNGNGYCDRGERRNGDG